jgi:hypothetical protein
MLTNLQVLYDFCCFSLADAWMKWSTILNSYVLLVVAIVAEVVMLARSGGVVVRLRKMTVAR